MTQAPSEVTYCLCVLMMLAHIAFAGGEMFFWHSHLGRRIAKVVPRNRLSDTELDKAVTWAGFLSFNQGVYNLFLAAGFFACLGPQMTVDPDFVHFFGFCVIAAGIAGAISGIRSTLYIQSLPGLLIVVAAARGW